MLLYGFCHLILSEPLSPADEPTNYSAALTPLGIGRFINLAPLNYLELP